jgi:sec-independent protein translocase protein TatA
MFGLRLPELLIILVVLVLLFGAKKLPELGDSLGKGIRAFKKAAEHGLRDDDSETKEAKEAKVPGQLRTGNAKAPASTDVEKAHKGDGGSP